jgi:hypothetical protein
LNFGSSGGAARANFARYPHSAQNGDWLEFRCFCETSCLYLFCLTTNLTCRNLRRRTLRAERPFSEVDYFWFCGKLRSNVRLGRARLAATRERPSMGLFPGHAPAEMALSRLGARTPPSLAPVRFRFSPARRKPGAKLRYAVLQTVQGLLLRKIGQARPPRWPKLDRLVEVPRRLRTTACGAWNRGSESGCGSDRGQPGPSGVVRAKFAGLAA